MKVIVSVGGVNVGDGVNVSVEGMEITVSVKGTLVNVWVAAAGCEAEAVGAPAVVKMLQEVVVKMNTMKKYIFLFFIL